jgi:hypothetical protein
MATEKPTPMERLEKLEVWARRSFVVSLVSAAFLGMMAAMFAYSQIAVNAYRAAEDARVAKIDRESEEQRQEMKRESAMLQAKADARDALLRENSERLKKSFENPAPIKFELEPKKTLTEAKEDE